MTSDDLRRFFNECQCRLIKNRVAEGLILLGLGAYFGYAAGRLVQEKVDADAYHRRTYSTVQPDRNRGNRSGYAYGADDWPDFIERMDK